MFGDWELYVGKVKEWDEWSVIMFKYIKSYIE